MPTVKIVYLAEDYANGIKVIEVTQTSLKNIKAPIAPEIIVKNKERYVKISEKEIENCTFPYGLLGNTDVETAIEF